MEVPVRIEDAVGYLREHPTGFASDRFADEGSALAMVQRLLQLGAVRVSLLAARSVPLPNLMEVEFPTDRSKRKALFALLAQEWDRCNEDFAADPNGRPPGREITREDAEAMGHPDAEGEWAEDIGEPLDDGQTVVTLWWD